MSGGASRIPDLIRRARRMSEQRDRLVASLARQWADALRGQGFSAQDLDELWAGLVEEAVRQLQRSGKGRWPLEAVRREAVGVVREVRERVTRELSSRLDRT